MAKMLDRVSSDPRKPTMKRRAKADGYEVIALLIWMGSLILGSAILFLASNTGIFGTNLILENNSLNLYLSFGIWAVTSFALLRFDYSARKREGKTFQYNLSEYEMLRTKTLEQRETMLALQTESMRVKHKREVSALREEKKTIPKAAATTEVISETPKKTKPVQA
jgi:hypothetical protein